MDDRGQRRFSQKLKFVIFFIEAFPKDSAMWLFRLLHLCWAAPEGDDAVPAGQGPGGQEGVLEENLHHNSRWCFHSTSVFSSLKQNLKRIFTNKNIILNPTVSALISSKSRSSFSNFIFYKKWQYLMREGLKIFKIIYIVWNIKWLKDLKLTYLNCLRYFNYFWYRNYLKKLPGFIWLWTHHPRIKQFSRNNNF